MEGGIFMLGSWGLNRLKKESSKANTLNLNKTKINQKLLWKLIKIIENEMW